MIIFYSKLYRLLIEMQAIEMLKVMGCADELARILIIENEFNIERAVDSYINISMSEPSYQRYIPPENPVTYEQPSHPAAPVNKAKFS